MEKLTSFEKTFVETVLKNEKRRVEKFLQDNENSFEAYFAKSETLPMLENILKKFEN